MNSRKLFTTLFAGAAFTSLSVGSLHAQSAPPSPTALDRSLEQQRQQTPNPPPPDTRQGGDYTRSPKRPDANSHFRRRDNDHKPNSNHHRPKESWRSEAPWHSHRR